MQIGICLGIGMGPTQVADYMKMDRKSIYLRRQTNPKFIDLVEAITKAASASMIAEIRQQAKDQAEKHIFRLAPKAAQKLEQLLEQGDDNAVKFAIKELLDRGLGKATQKIETTVSGEVKNTYQVSGNVLAAIAGVAALTSKYGGGLPVLEAETIDNPEASEASPLLTDGSSE